MADRRDEAAAGLLLSDAPPLVAPDKADDAAGTAADTVTRLRPAERRQQGRQDPHDQPSQPGKQKKRDARTLRPAPDKPIARIAVDLPLAHLDRPFDYLVPERLADRARPGARVRVRFAGQLTDGFLVERAAASEHQGSLRYLERVVSAEPVLTPEIAGLARAVADRYAGTLADVLRLAIPQRHAATEAASDRARQTSAPARQAGALARPEPGSWARYPAGRSFLDALAGGRPARAAWMALPGPSWPDEIARAALTTASAGRGTVIVVPDARDLARVDAALAELAGEAGLAAQAPAGTATALHVTLTADLGPAERYRRWLAALRGETLIVAGTRAAMFAPVSDLGLVVLWDDGDDLHAEPRAPYPHAREVLALRAHRAGAAALIGGFARTAEMTQLVRSGWAHHLGPDRPTLRATAPRVRPAADVAELGRDEAATTARLPTLALRTARDALRAGPVLIQVPRRGYLAGIACARCRAPGRCTHPAGNGHASSVGQTPPAGQTPSAGQTPPAGQPLSAGQPLCNGPLRLSGPAAAPDCRWCGALATGPGGWHCPRCGHDRLRATITGATRTAEELGRAFPGFTVRTSGGDQVLASVPGQPALVIATPGAEPLADYAAALLLDGWALLSRPSLRAGEETLRRWLGAAALVRHDGTVLVHADQSLPATQALVRWDPVTFAERDLAERAELGFPPAVRMAAVSGEQDAVAAILAGTEPGFEVLGPVPLEAQGPQQGGVRALVRAPRAEGAALAKALAAAQAGRSARKEGGGVRVQLDPPDPI
ncbi:primosomal protein N' [Trebonia kvetii]|uniref:Probable replication restart protein PriA n=1 Tax=Trebonia kvetii TaxID=2480626 RepID=A0A6P2BW28_9ACTN|nr:primosomal protein N' [Trebonia kvetii]TVZ03138.1 primosomal protein N' [Trebonia kvetii]